MSAGEAASGGEKPLSLFGVEFAPLGVPLRRRLQTLAVIWHVYILFFAPFVCGLIPVYLLFYTNYWWLVLAYAAWFYYTKDVQRQGSKFRWRALLRSSMWRYFCDYFPIKLVKTADLDPNRNYILACHPHGIISYGIFGSIGTDTLGFDRLFPGIETHIMTLAANFTFPFRREYFMFMGGCDVSKESIQYCLKLGPKEGGGGAPANNNDTEGPAPGGHACVIVVGGAEEGLDAHPGMADLTLKGRKGFCKMALRCGADLVPVYTFGENELYEQVANPRGSPLRKWQTAMKKRMGFSPPIFYGRGVFNYTFGVLPRRHPLHTVVGAPIAVGAPVDSPDQAAIDGLHERYLDALTKLFDDNKEKYGCGGQTLRFF